MKRETCAKCKNAKPGDMCILDEMQNCNRFEEKETGKMYTTELIERVRKEPEKYEGKRYNISHCVDGICEFVDEIIICNGVISEILSGGRKQKYLVYFSDISTVTEIREPKLVDFMTAINSGKPIISHDFANERVFFNTPKQVIAWLCHFSTAFILHYINGQWEIEGDEE